jgi:surfactin synthase thioesterase subunit
MSTWFPTASSAADARPTLFCFPHGGGDVSSFLDWQSGMGDRIDVAPASLPGRGRRITEPLLPSITGLADRLVEPTLSRAPGAYALFGHSMGALIAFELAHRLTAAGRPPALLMVSGSAAPQARQHCPPTQDLSDDDFLDFVDTLGGVPPGLLDNPDMWDLVRPILRADFQAAEIYRYAERPTLDVPVLVLGGDRDPAVDSAELEQWRAVTTGQTTVRLFAGGHFFMVEQLDDVLAVLHAAVDTATAPGQESAARP